MKNPTEGKGKTKRSKIQATRTNQLSRNQSKRSARIQSHHKAIAPTPMNTSTQRAETGSNKTKRTTTNQPSAARPTSHNKSASSSKTSHQPNPISPLNKSSGTTHTTQNPPMPTVEKPRQGTRRGAANPIKTTSPNQPTLLSTHSNPSKPTQQHSVTHQKQPTYPNRRKDPCEKPDKGQKQPGPANPCGATRPGHSAKKPTQRLDDASAKPNATQSNRANRIATHEHNCSNPTPTRTHQPIQTNPTAPQSAEPIKPPVQERTNR